MAHHNPNPDHGALGDRKLNYGALADLFTVMVVLVVVKQTALTVTFLYAGPISTITAMVVGTFLLRRRQFGWADLGLRWPQSWWKVAGLTVFTILVFVLAVGTMEDVADHFFEDVGASGRFDHVEGNFGAYLVVMLLVWTHSAFFEELLFRAFVISKASLFLGGSLAADLAAAVFSAVFFGYRHYYYQGMNGALTTGAAGLAFALLYLWFGRRNILPLVLTHGIVDSIGMTLRYTGFRD